MVAGKKSYAFVPKAPFGAAKSLAALMKSMEGEGMLIKTSDIRAGGDVNWRLLEKRHSNEKPIEIQKISYDPRRESHYVEATSQKKLIFTPVHFSPLVRNSPVVTVAEPVFDGRGRLRVVISSDIYLQGISAYLRGMRLPPYSVAFIFDRAGHLIASSTIEANGESQNDVQPARGLPSVLDSSDPVIRKTGRRLIEHIGGFAVGNAISFRYVSHKQHSYVYATHLFREFELDWNLAVVIAEDGLIQNLVKGIQWTAWISALLLALAIGIGLVTAAWMIRPILTLRSVAAALEREDLDDDHLQVRQLERDTRRRDEFGTLAQTFLSMIREVRARHDLLESQLEQLRVGVDHNEAAKQVADIAGTDFFRSLKDKARALRQKNPAADTKS
jgi:HAMP domain-containing protein